jgi:hypothetical protein
MNQNPMLAPGLEPLLRWIYHTLASAVGQDGAQAIMCLGGLIVAVVFTVSLFGQIGRDIEEAVAKDKERSQ